MLSYRRDGEKWRVDMEKKWYSMELSKAEWAGIRPIIKELGCRYEAGECGELIHVEVYCTSDIAEVINDKIDEL